MTDKELLELAAKAAGMITLCDERGCWFDDADRMWNPLTDDGDALRLAVKLNIIWDIHIDPDERSKDMYESVRRWIVRAAAVGKDMK